MKKVFLVLLLCLSANLRAQALTDLWWVPEESGWGLTTVHEQNSMVVTLYAHDAAHQPRWYTSALLRYGNTAAGDPEFLGDLYETDGTPLTDPWNPQDVSRRQVGRLFFRARPDGEAEIEYTVDGSTVIKRVRRFTLQEDRLEGMHFATLLRRYDDCDNGFQGVIVDQGILHIDRSSGPPGTPPRQLVDMAFTHDEAAVCSFAGAFARYGQSGGMRGLYACSDGSSGPVEFKNIEFNSFGFSARFTAENEHCAGFSGILTGTRTSAR